MPLSHHSLHLFLFLRIWWSEPHNIGSHVIQIDLIRWSLDCILATFQQFLINSFKLFVVIFVEIIDSSAHIPWLFLNQPPVHLLYIGNICPAIIVSEFRNSVLELRWLEKMKLRFRDLVCKYLHYLLGKLSLPCHVFRNLIIFYHVKYLIVFQSQHLFRLSFLRVSENFVAVCNWLSILLLDSDQADDLMACVINFYSNNWLSLYLSFSVVMQNLGQLLVKIKFKI